VGHNVNKGILCRGLKKTYGENVVLNGVDLAVAPGELVALSSPSGGGKTTLLNILGGLTTADAGHLEVAGKDLTRLGEDARALLRRHSVGVMHQSSYLFPWLSVDENLAMTPVRPDLEDWTKSLRRDLGIDDFRSTATNQLSGGQRRRVCLLRAVQCGPEVLLLDEPTTGLDETLSILVREVLRTAADRGAAVLVATHDATTVAVADRTAILAEKMVSA
jgi:putative ABC transport system ATP-binding protein